VADLARQLKIPFSHRPLWPADVVAADEVLLASTSSALLPVVRVDNRPIADGRPGPMFARLLAAWSDAVGLDIRAQAEAVSG